MLIDAHTHLNGELLFPNRQQHLEDFERVGGKMLVNAGANEFYNQNALTIAQEAKILFPKLKVKSTLGYLPGDIQHFRKNDFSQMIQKVEELYLKHMEHIVAIGETGIDLHYPNGANLEDQQYMFRLQAELARKYQLPLVVHSRDAFDETMEVLQDFTDVKLYFHCRGYGAEEVKRAEQMFSRLRLGFTGVITYPKAHATRESLWAMKTSKVLIETDAPYLPPQDFRGKTNYPAYVRYVYEKCAEVLEIGKEELENQVEENFCNIF
ncbi:MAG: TatD family hydrolase [Candidatus Peribacteria bacterium]|jgi:TatD DNase family protein|nr:TatD family hydrolase [Candidatus Peribacteria bacterium]